MITKTTRLKLALYFLALSIAFILLFLPMFINKTNADIPAFNPNIISCTCVTNTTQTCASVQWVEFTQGIANSCNKNNGLYNVRTEFPSSIFGGGPQRAGNDQSSLIGTNGDFFNGTRQFPYTGGFAPYTGDIPYAYLYYGFLSGLVSSFFNTTGSQNQVYSGAISTSNFFPVWSGFYPVIGSDTSVPCRTQNTNGTLKLTGYTIYSSYEGSGYPGDEWTSFARRGNYSCY